jgi:hypothetical protein
MGGGGWRNLELAAREPSHLASERAQRLQHEPGESPRHQPGQRQGEGGQGHRLTQGRVQLSTQQGRAEAEADAPEGRAVQIHRQHHLVGLPHVVQDEKA